MGLIDYIRDIFIGDWSVDTRFEFYRGYLDKFNVSLNDYRTLYTLEESINQSIPLSLEEKNTFMFCTNRMIINKSDKEKLEELRTECINTKALVANPKVMDTRIARVDKILNNFNRPSLNRMYLFNKGDIGYIMAQFSGADDYIGVGELIDFLDGSIVIVPQRRALIAATLYLYSEYNLASCTQQFKVDYFSKEVINNLTNFLYKEIRS